MDGMPPLYYNVEVPGAEIRILGCVEGTRVSSESVMASLEDLEPQVLNLNIILLRLLF